MRLISKILLGTAAAASVATAGIAYAAPGQDGAAPARPDITRAQAAEQAGKMFDKLDFNKDGKIDAADFKARRDARLQALFDRLDTNKNGSITRDEFMAGMEHGRRGPDGRQAEGKPGEGRHFGGGHRGGPGGMMHHRMGGMGGMGGGMMKPGQGPVTKSEFVAARLAKFDAADTNHDGVLTAQERQAEREKMRAEWQAKRAEWKAQHGAQQQQKAD